MKLIIAIVQDDYMSKVAKALMESKISSTKLSSTGGFLKAGNTTLVVGVEDDQVDTVIDLIKSVSSTQKVRKDRKDRKEVNISAANIFVLDIDQYVKL